MNEVQSLAAIFISLGWCSCCCSMLLYRFRSRFLYIILYIIISIPLSLSPILFSLPIFIALSAFLLAGFIHTIIYCESCVFGEMSLCMRESAAALCYFDSTIHENAVAVHKNWKEITYTRLLQQQPAATSKSDRQAVKLWCIEDCKRWGANKSAANYANNINSQNNRTKAPVSFFSLIIAISISSARIFFHRSLSLPLSLPLFGVFHIQTRVCTQFSCSLVNCMDILIHIKERSN